MHRWALFQKKQEQRGRIERWLSETKRTGEKLSVLIKRQGTGILEWRDEIVAMLGAEPVHGVLTVVETEIKYSGYLAQQERQIARLKDAGGRLIPEDFDFAGIPGLSTEVQHKLQRVRPETLGQAGRIPGVTPAAIAVLDVYLSLRGQHAG